MNKECVLTFALFLVCLFAPRCDAQSEPEREWTDTTGKFKVQAKLLQHAGEKVILLKSDGRQITVPYAVLSLDDQTYLYTRDGAKVKDPFAGGEPAPMRASGSGSTTGGDRATRSSSTPMNSSASQSIVEPVTPPAAPAGSKDYFTSAGDIAELPTGEPLNIKIDTEVSGLVADPEPPANPVKANVWSFPGFDAYVKWSKSPFWLDRARGVFAFSCFRQSNAVSPEAFGRVYAIAAGERQAKLALELQDPIVLLDHHESSGRSLMTVGADELGRGGDLCLVHGLGGSATPIALARWHVPEHDKPGFKPTATKGWLLDQSHAVVVVDNSIYCWDLLAGTCSWQINNITYTEQIAISGTRRYLALPDSGAARYVDVREGAYLGRVKFDTLLTPTLRFSPNGRFLAMVAGNKYFIWDQEQASALCEMTIGTSSGEFYGWIGNEYLLTAHGGLIDPVLQMPLWNYGFPSSSLTLSMARSILCVDPDSSASLAMTVPIPHRTAEQAITRLTNQKNAWSVQPGSKVSVEIAGFSGPQLDSLRQSFTSAIEKLGWSVSDNAKLKVTATLSKAESREFQFRSMIPGSIRDAPTTVSIRPYEAIITIDDNGNQLWKSFPGVMVPSLLNLKEGETVQAKMQQYEEPDPNYFNHVIIPARVLSPKAAQAIGTTTLKNGTWSDR